MSHIIKIKNLRKNEKVVLVVRKHWFVFFRDVVGILLLFFVPFFAIPVLGVFITAGTPSADIPAGFGFFFASFWALILWQMLFTRWTDYYYDVWIITSERIIDIEQKGFFHRDVATLFNLNYVQDVTTVLTGVIGNMLGFGKLQVQTAAATDEFIMYDIADPVRVEHIIRETQKKYYPPPTEAGPPPE